MVKKKKKQHIPEHLIGCYALAVTIFAWNNQDEE